MEGVSLGTPSPGPWDPNPSLALALEWGAQVGSQQSLILRSGRRGVSAPAV